MCYFIELDEGASKIAEAIQKNPGLTSIDFSNNKISDAGANALGLALKNTQSVNMLHLENNQIGDGGVKQLTSLPTLIELNLANNRITTQGAQYIAEELENHKSLTSLELCRYLWEKPRRV